MAVTALELGLVIVGTVLSLSGWSFVFFGDTLPFTISESIFIGGAMALSIFNAINGLQSSSIEMILAGHVTLIIPLIVGILAFTRLTKWRWAARYSVSVSAGIGVGLIFGLQIKSNILLFITEGANTLISGTPDPISGVLMFIISLLVPVYFLYSKRFSEYIHEGRLRPVMRVGRILMYVAWGYLFGKIFVDEGIDAVATFMVTYIYRTWGMIQEFLVAMV